MVKIEFDLPENIYQALKLLSDTFKVPVEQILVQSLEYGIQGSMSTGLEDYVEPIIKEIEAILNEPDDTCSGLHQTES